MQLRTLGRSGLLVSEHCLGTMTFGAETPEADAHAILDAFVAAGGTFIDTADVYAAGESERIIGRWLAARGGAADRGEADLAMGGRTIPAVYETTLHEPPHRVVLETSGSWFRGRDDIRVAAGDEPGTSRVTWDATFALRGPLMLLDPLLARGFRRVAARAVDGLRLALAARGGAA
ncbi:MAG: aldo/keto reductase [Nitriliruptoraceae bacterium]